MMTGDSKTRPKGRHWRISRPVRAVLCVFVVLLALYGAAVAVMRTDWFNRFLVRHVTAMLENATGARVEIGRITLRPAILQVTFYGLVLRGEELSTEAPLFSAPVIVVSLNPASLLRRRLLLRALDCQGAQIHIYTNADGSTNFPRPRAAIRGSNAVDGFIDLAIHRLAIVGTTFFWNDRRVPLDLHARDVALMLSFRPPGQYGGVLSSLGVSLAVRGWTLPAITFSTKLGLSRDRLDLASLVWRCAGLAGQAALRSRFSPSLAAELSLEGAGDLRELARALGFHDLGGGTVRWTTDADYQAGNFEARGRVQARDLAVRSPSVEPGRISLSADYLADRHRVELSHLAAELLGGRALGQARVALGGPAPQFAVRTRLEGFDLARVLDSASGGKAVLSELPVASRVTGNLQASWRGKLRDFAARFDLAFEPRKGPLQAGTLPVTGVAQGTVSLAKGQPAISLERAEIYTPHSSLTAQRALNGPASNLNVRFETSDFEEWRSVSESFAETLLPVLLRSTAVFAGTLSGSLTRPEIRGRFTLGAFSYRNWKWDHFEANIDATSDHVTVSSGKLVGETSALTFDASAGLDRWQLAQDATVRLSAEAEKTPIQGLENALGLSYPVEGQLTGRVQVQGTRQNLTGSATVRIDQGTLENESFDSLSAQMQVARSVWNVRSIELAKGSGRLAGQARLDVPRSEYSVELRGTNFSLADFRTLQRLGPRVAGSEASAETGVEGQVDFELGGSGTLDHPQIHSTVQARALRLNGNALGDFSGNLDWARAELRLQGSLQGGDGTVHLTGEARTADNWPADITADYTKLRADPWIRSLRLQKFGARVTVTGSTHLTGPLKTPRQLEVRSHNPELAVSFPGMAWKNDRPIDLTLARDVLMVSSFQLSGPSTRFAIQGSIRFAQPAALDLTAKGQIDAALLAAFDASILTAGKFDVELRAGGTTADPRLYGTVNVDGVSLGYTDFPLRVANLNGQIRLEGDRLTIVSLRGSTGQSSTSFSGFASLSGVPHYDLRATLDRARIEYPIDFTSLITGNLHLVGSSQGGALNGYLTVQQMFVPENFNVVDWIGEMANSPAAPASETPSLASKIRLNLRVASEPSVRVESHDLSMTAQVDLTVRGTAADPVAFGTVHLVNGRLVVRNNSTYTITRGDITMANPVRTQPVLDIEAETRIQTYKITLTVTGPAERPRISYRSEPPLPSSDILGLLAFGHARQGEQMSASGRSNFSTLGASALLSQALSSQVSGRIQRLFGLSRIAIDPNPGGSGGTRVTVEEQITHDFTITYINTTGGLQQRVIQVEWDLSENVSLLGVRDQNGVFGFELDFRHRFK